MADPRRVRSEQILSAASSVVGMGVGLFLVILVAHERGRGAAGVLFGAIALFSVVGTVVKLGTETSLVYFVGREGDRLDRASLLGVLRLALAPVSVVSATLGIAAVVWARPMAQLLIDPDHVDEYSAVLRVLGPFLPLWAFSLVLLGATRGLGDMRPTIVGLQLVQPMLQLLLVACVLKLGAGPSLIALAWCLPLITTTLLAIQRLSSIPMSSDGTDPWAGPTRREFWSYSAPRGVAGSLTVALDRLAVVLVAGLGSAELAGAWVAITRLVGVSVRVTHVLGQSLNSRLSRLSGERGEAEAQLTVQAGWWTTTLLGPMLTTLAVFPEAALSIFGMGTVPTAAAGLRLGALVGLVIAVFAHVDNVLLMRGHSLMVMADSIPSLTSLVLLSVWWIPDHGLLGAAGAWLVSVVIYRSLALGQMWRVAGFSPVGADTWRVLGALALGGSLAVGVRTAIGSGLAAAVMGGGLAALVVVFVAVRVGPAQSGEQDSSGLAIPVEMGR